MQSGDKIDNLISFIDDLKSNLQSDQSSDDSISDSKNAFWNSSIAQLNSEIDALNKEIAALQLEVSQLQLELNDLQKQVLILTEQLTLLDQKQANLEAARAADIEAYNTRVAKQHSMIMALDIIIANLTVIVDNDSFIQKDQVIEQLKGIGKNNALVGLLTLSTSFSPATVKAIIQKLKEIRESLQASVDLDDANELVAETNYLNLIYEFENTRTTVKQSLQNLNDRIAEIQQEITDDTTKINDDSQQVTIDQQQVDEYVKEQQAFNVLYQTRYEARLVYNF